jgi:predicted AlkP superfamily phosphohydrolase/phosphomutase
MATRMIVVGLDGATFDLIKPWVAEGKLPTFARLLAEGAHAELRGTLPMAPTSLATSAATGTNPGKHNVFGDSRATDDLHGRRVWDVAAEHGKRAALVRLPLTHGAKRLVRGVVISEITPANGADAEAVDDVRAFRDELLDLQRMQNSEMLTLLEHEEWDLLWVGFDALDKVQRFFWHYMDGTHPAHPGSTDLGDTILRAYGLVDDGLAEILKRLDERTGLLLVSCHGARGAESFVALGDWLEQSGFSSTQAERGTSVQRALTGIGNEAYAFLRALRRSGLGWLPNLVPPRPKPVAASAKGTAPRAAKRLDWSATRVFCQSATSGGLRVNLRGREPEGIVAVEDFDRVRREVRDALLQLVDPTSGRQVVRAVHFGEEAFRGPFAENGPDLVVEAAEPYCLVEGRDGAAIVDAGRRDGQRTGNRTRTGIFVLVGRAARAGAEVAALDVCDVAPTLLHLLGLPVPNDLDGVVASAAIAHDTERVAPDLDRRLASTTSEGLGYQ